MRLANQSRRVAGAGAEIIALSVDTEERNEAMRRRWGLPFPILSDPGGEGLLQPLDLWNPDERGGIAWPALLILDADGSERLRRRSNDFADRTHDDDVLGTLEELGLTAVDPPDRASPDDDPGSPEGAFPVEAFIPLMNGNRFGALALSRRVEDEAAQRTCREHAEMAKSFVEAWKERRSD